MNDPLATLDTLLSSDSKIESHQAASAPQGSMVKPTCLVLDGNRIEFHNAREPQYDLQSERPIHRNIALMAMRGYNNTEIAAELGVTSAMVNYTLLQPWVKQYMSENMHNHGMQKVETLLKGAVADAVERLIEEMDNPKNRGSERISAAVHIIERVYGRAAQPIIHSQAKPEKDMSDAELDQEIQRLRSQRGS